MRVGIMLFWIDVMKGEMEGGFWVCFVSEGRVEEGNV